MVIFAGNPYPIDIVYLKLAGQREVVSIPFIEAVGILNNVTYDFKASEAESVKAGQSIYVIKGDTEKEKNRTFQVTKEDLMHRLQQDIYGEKQKIADMAIQPQDELLTPEVKKLIEL